MIVGFELTSHSIRAVAFERGRIGYAPDRFTEVPFSPDEDGLPTPDAVREAARGLGVVAELAALATPADWCHFRTVRFPYKSPGRIDSTLKYVVEGRVPGPIDDYTVEPLGAPKEDTDGASLYIAACRTARLTMLLERFRSAGLDPAAVMPVPSALASSAGGAKGVSLIARKGPDGIDLVLCNDGRLAAAGCISVNDDVARIGEEVRRTVELWCAAEGRARPEGIRLIGEDDGLSGALREATGLPVERVELKEGVAVAWGAAKEAAEKKSAAVSFRRGELAYQPYAQRLEKRLAAALVLGAALLAVVSVGIVRRTSEVADVLRQVGARQSDLYREVTGAPGPVNTIAMEATLATETKAVAQRGGAGVSCLRRWIDLMNLLPADGGFVFSNLNFSQSGVTFTATAGKGASAWELNNRITASQVFERDEAFRVDERMPDGRVKFTMELKYK